MIASRVMRGRKATQNTAAIQCERPSSWRRQTKFDCQLNLKATFAVHSWETKGKYEEVQRASAMSYSKANESYTIKWHCRMSYCLLQIIWAYFTYIGYLHFDSFGNHDSKQNANKVCFKMVVCGSPIEKIASVRYSVKVGNNSILYALQPKVSTYGNWG
mgnify:CR=1 FL=1